MIKLRWKVADSISRIAIQIADESHRPELLLISSTKYISSNNVFIHYKDALAYTLKG